MKSLCLIKHHVMKACYGVEVQLQVIINLGTRWYMNGELDAPDALPRSQL
jgi:hypothetical protein